MKTKIIAIIISSILVSIIIIPLFFTNIHIRTSSETYEFGDYKIKVIMRSCITCLMDATIKKKVYVTEGNKRTQFNLNTPKDGYYDRDTRIIIGESKLISEFKKENIDYVAFFPSDLEKMEMYNYENGNDLNDGTSLNSHYYQYLEKRIDVMKSELLVQLDTILKYPD